MINTQATITIIGGDAGVRAEVTCPDCQEVVYIAENPWWKQECKCKQWILEIKAVGTELE